MSLSTGARQSLRRWLALAASIGVILSTLVAASAEAASYSAPKEVAAANVTKNSVELTWRTITGAPAYQVRAVPVDGGATLYQSTGSDGTTVFKNLKPSTKYKFTVAVWQTTTSSRLSAWSASSATATTTSSAMLDAPTDLSVADGGQAPTALALTWTAPAGYDAGVHVFRIDFAQDQTMKSGGGTRYLAGTSGTLTGLSSNTNYYLRIRLVANDSVHTVVGDRSISTLAKTLSPIGWIHGTVTGAPASALKHYVAAAYSAATGDVNEQVDLQPTAEPGVYGYKLKVRPGKYFVQVLNINPADHNYTSAWVGGSLVRSQATAVSVSVSKVTEVGALTVAAGAIIKGRVTCPGQSTKDSCAVDVTAMIGTSVVGSDRSDAQGNYVLQGLPAATYTIRMNHSEDRFLAKNTSIALTTGTTTLDKTLERRKFLRTYAVKISGTKRVGSVLRISSKYYLAAVLPTERADNNDFQWYRNGSPISGAHGSKYKLTSADRGKSIRLGVRFGRFGFVTAAEAYSKSYRIS